MSEPQMDLRRRRALYRATHRGSKELDFLLGRFAVETIPEMSSSDLAAMEELIEAPDPLIAECVYEGTSLEVARLDELICRMRRFHGFVTANANDETRTEYK